MRRRELLVGFAGAPGAGHYSAAVLVSSAEDLLLRQHRPATTANELLAGHVGDGTQPHIPERAVLVAGYGETDNLAATWSTARPASCCYTPSDTGRSRF